MDEPRPRVSLVVLNWNGRRHLDTCLSSLLSLDYPEDRLEVILADNGSTDGSAEHVRERYPRVRLLAFDTNHGFARGNNLAAAKASGEWLGFLNNDMRVEPDWLRTLLEARDDDPEATCIASRIVNWNGSAIDFIGGGVNLTGHGFQVDYGEPDSKRDVARRVLFACGGAMLIRREVYQQVGGFDGDYFAYFEDVDLGWRLNVLGHHVWYTPRATAYHRHHSTGRRLDAHRLRLLYERNALYTIYKNMDDAHLATALPVALYLLNERAMSIAGLQRSEYLMDPEEIASVASAARQRQTLYAFDPAAAGAESLPRKFVRILRREGPRMLALKGARYARYRARAGVTRAATRLATRDGVLVHKVAISHYAALSDFAHHLDRLSARRRWIQGRRRRPDAEIIPLMVDPLWSNYSAPAYLDFYKHLARVFDLERCFPRTE